MTNRKILIVDDDAATVMPNNFISTADGSAGADKTTRFTFSLGLHFTNSRIAGTDT